VTTSELETSAYGVAFDLMRGATAEVVTLQYHQAPRFAELDGTPAVVLPTREAREVHAVRVTYPNGFVAHYLASSTQLAEALLTRAKAIVAIPPWIVG
jgi:hypothetical protein